MSMKKITKFKVIIHDSKLTILELWEECDMWKKNSYANYFITVNTCGLEPMVHGRYKYELEASREFLRLYRSIEKSLPQSQPQRAGFPHRSRNDPQVS